ncbi:hypothetical protein GCM10011335_26390 [Aureimonas glaciei]|uniref:Uncharacterized protein n=1 Tax=Aureimonas glaciei TaxID=1776957 RepID=A0A916XYI8_9HYPH|nr:hypothetical protein GCM10011335_26390 [Aureimonas glaciei]
MSADFLHDDGALRSRVVDFLVVHEDGSEILMDAAGPLGVRLADPGAAYSSVAEDEIRIEPALTNAREMMRYARWTTPLGDRVRLLAWLDDVGSVPLIEAAAAMRGSGEPVGMVMALVLKRFVTIDWRKAPIGPETLVSLRR